MTSKKLLIPSGLLSMVLCAFMPWRAPDVFKNYDEAESDGKDKQFLIAGLILFFGISIFRNVGFENASLVSLVMAMSIGVVVPMLFSFPAALVFAGVSIGVDFALLILLVVGQRLDPWAMGAWEILALVLSYFFVWRSKRG